MRGRIPTVSLAILAFVVTGCNSPRDTNANPDKAAPTAAAGAKTDKSADEAALRAVYQKIPQYAASGTVDSLAAFFADDGTEIMAGMPPAKGVEGARKAFAAAFGPMKSLKLTLGDVAVHVADSGDLAVVAAPYEFTYKDTKGKSQRDHGTTMTVFKKVSGQWKILYDTNISDIAPPQ